jgi:hypothetical protein
MTNIGKKTQKTQKAFEAIWFVKKKIPMLKVKGLI